MNKWRSQAPAWTCAIWARGHQDIMPCLKWPCPRPRCLWIWPRCIWWWPWRVICFRSGSTPRPIWPTRTSGTRRMPTGRECMAWLRLWVSALIVQSHTFKSETVCTVSLVHLHQITDLRPNRAMPMLEKQMHQSVQITDIWSNRMCMFLQQCLEI